MESDLPRHVAVIMDGNGRWAQKRLLPRSAGHSAGMKRMIALSEYLFDRGVEVVTLYALSQENLSRSKEELAALFALFRQYFAGNVERLVKNDLRLDVIGELSLLPEDIRALIVEGKRRTEAGKRGTLVLAIAYGARQDILSAVNRAVRAGKEVTEGEFFALLSTGAYPPPDLLIRTGKEKRLSNFLLYESAYAELYFSDKMFPAFTDADMARALENYASRDRRFGRVKEENS